MKTVHRSFRSAAAAFGCMIAAMCGRTNVLTAQAGKPAMAKMDTGGSASQDRTMKVMMGVPLPFGIMIGRAERWMVGYQFMSDRLDGILDGTRGVTATDVLGRFQTTPVDMSMQMHMAMVMYAPTARFTLMVGVPYVKMSMGELHRDGTRSTERSDGIGDLEFRGLYSLYSTPHLRHRILANLGVGVPTGSVDQLDAEGIRTEYPMQTGSGTLSLLPGITYLGQALPWSWGADASSTVRIGTNAHGYRLGNRFEPKIWVARQLTKVVSLSAGATGEVWDNIHGSDALLDATDEPAKDPSLQGGRRLNASLGITVHPSTGFFTGQQILIQGDVPIIQSLNGPQLKRSYLLHVAWQLEF